MLLFFSFCYNTAYNFNSSNKNRYFFLLFSLSLTLYNSTNNNVKKFVPSFTFIIRPFWYLKFFLFYFFFLCILLQSIPLIVIRIAIFSFFFLRFIFIPWTPYKMGILILFLYSHLYIFIFFCYTLTLSFSSFFVYLIPILFTSFVLSFCFFYLSIL